MNIYWLLTHVVIWSSSTVAAILLEEPRIFVATCIASCIVIIFHYFMAIEGKC